MVTEAIKIGQIRNLEISSPNDVRFSQGVNSITKYSLTVLTKHENKRKGFILKKRGYLIDLHQYNGFAMLKYYPRHLKDNPNKFKMRGENLGYVLTISQIRGLFWECAKIMKNYLEAYPNNFVGFVGQPDEKDDAQNRRREFAQRASIYNRYVDSLFMPPKFNTSSPKIFEEINLRLIRKIRDKKAPFQLNESQKANYLEFMAQLELTADVHADLMTEVTRLKIYNESDPNLNEL